MKLREILQQKNENYYVRLKNVISKLEESYLRFSTLPYFTSHGIDHSESIEKIIESLIPENKKQDLNEVELFILLCSIYFHDVGMAVQLEGDEQRENESKREYQQRLESIRRTHSERAHNFIIEKYEKFGLDKGTALSIAEICRAHSDIKYLDRPWVYTYDELSQKAHVKAVEKFDVRMLFIAALLRLADELDLDYYRALADLEEIRDMPIISRREWMKHQIISGIKIDSKEFKIYVDIFEDDVYGAVFGKLARDELTAQKNMGLTEVVIKLRRSLLEVQPALMEAGLPYRYVKFRDPEIIKLERILRTHQLSKDEGYSVLQDDSNCGARIQWLRAEIEALNLSPEFLISNSIHYLFNRNTRFIDELPYNLHRYIIPSKSEKEICEQSIFTIREKVLGFLNDYNFLGLYSQEDLEKQDETIYPKLLDALTDEVLKNELSWKFVLDLRRFIYTLLERYQKGILSKLFDLEGLKQSLFENAITDFFNTMRKKNHLKKSKKHFLISIFNHELFQAAANAMRRSCTDEKQLRTRMEWYLNEMKATLLEHPNILIYYTSDEITTECQIITSELTLLSSLNRHGAIIVQDANKVIDYYTLYRSLIENKDTWRIKDVIPKELIIQFDREDEYYQKQLKFKEKFADITEERLHRLIERAIFLDEIVK